MTELLRARWKECRISTMHQELGCPDVFESTLHRTLLSETLGLMSTGHYITTLFMNDPQIAATPDPRARVMELLTRIDKVGGAIIEMETGHIYQDPRFMPQPDVRLKPYVREFATLDAVINGTAVVPQAVPNSAMQPRYAPHYFKRVGFENGPVRAQFGIPLRAIRASRRTPQAGQVVREIIGEEAAAAAPLMHAEGPLRLAISWPTLKPFSSSSRSVPTTTDLVHFIYDFVENIAQTPENDHMDPPIWRLCVEKPAGGSGQEVDDLVLAGIMHVEGDLWLPLLYIAQDD